MNSHTTYMQTYALGADHAEVPRLFVTAHENVSEHNMITQQQQENKQHTCNAVGETSNRAISADASCSRTAVMV